MLLDVGDQGGLGGVRTSDGMCLKIAPDKIVHWIYIIEAARRPLLPGDDVITELNPVF